VTRRDVVIALLTAGAVYAATMYGGPLAGRAAKVVVPVVVERVADRIEQKPLEEPPVWDVGLPREAKGTIGTADEARDARPCPGVEAGKRRITSPAPSDLAYYRALHREGLFPVTTHEARPTPWRLK